MTLTEYTDSLKGKRVTVVGMGVSNTPLIYHLLNNGINLTVCDRANRESLGTKADEMERLGGKLKLGDDYLDNIEADIIFRTPGLHPEAPGLISACEKGAVLTSEMEAFFEVCPCRIIGITGSDGKTTTTTLISEMLKAEGYTVHVGGNIGTPLLCDADKMSADDICVLELSSFQLMTMRRSPDIAVITNLAPNHLDIHKSMDEYVNAKKNIFTHQLKNNVLILNADNEITAGFAKEANGIVRTFSRRISVPDGACLEGEELVLKEEGNGTPVIQQSKVFLPGLHNIENFLAAFAALRGLVRTETMARVAETFTGVEHRIEFVRNFNGAAFYNDSIASSPSRTIAGLRSFNKKVILIAGGKDKGVPFNGLAEEIIEHVKLLIVTGKTAETIENCVRSSANYRGYPQIIRKDDFAAAVYAAADNAGAGDIVILSPACTSFDRFKNFAERGRYFKEIVNSLEEHL